MKIIKDLTAWRSQNSDQQLGFVPTMGCLHAGHASLVGASLDENDLTAVSIFVNPTQFNDASDWQNYPVTLDQDLQMLEAMGVDVCLLPERDTLYPDDYQYRVTTQSEWASWGEGTARPGHFDGMLTVVTKLLNWVRPNNLYMGAKDYQQAMLVGELIDALLLQTTIRVMETVREPSGLAISSRNNRLNPSQREIADEFATLFLDKRLTQDQLLAAWKQCGIDVEYCVEHVKRLFVAVRIGGIRLIDNRAL